MADFGGGIPGQIVGELASIPKAVVETITSATPSTTDVGTGGQGEGKAQETGQAASDPMAIMHQQKEAAAKKRLAEVRGELQEYFEKQKREKEQMEEAMEERKKEEEIQIKKSKKKQEEQEVLRRLSSQYGGTSETAKSGG